MNTADQIALVDPRRFLRLTQFADVPKAEAATDTLCLPFDLRTKTRWMVKLASGREALLVLPRGRAMRGGDQLVAADGALVNVVAADEALAHVTVANAHELLRVAYHLGNRHVAVEIGNGYLRVLQDSVLENMVRGLGATVEHVMAPFEPEAGAYAGSSADTHNHSHDHDHSKCTHDQHEHDHAHGKSQARIHDFSDAVNPSQ